MYYITIKPASARPAPLRRFQTPNFLDISRGDAARFVRSMNRDDALPDAAKDVVDAAFHLVKLEPRHALGQGRQQRADFHAGEIVADALMLAEAKAEMLVGCVAHHP